MLSVVLATVCEGRRQCKVLEHLVTKLKMELTLIKKVSTDVSLVKMKVSKSLFGLKL